MGNCLCQILSEKAKKVFICSVPYDLNYVNNLINIYVIPAYIYIYIYIYIYVCMPTCSLIVSEW